LIISRQFLLIVYKLGRSHLYRPGLERPTVARAAGRVAAASISITSDHADSWPLLAKRGHPFNMSRAVLRHYYEGQLLEQAEIWLRGRVVSPSWGTKDDPLSFRLERQLRLSGNLPSPTMRIDERTFDIAKIDPRVVGAVGPIVVGTPGKISGSLACPITPAYLVQFDGSAAFTNRFLIAYHDVAATTVTLHDLGATPPTSAPLTVKQDKDLLGQTYSYVDTSIGWTITNEGNKHLVAWDQGGGGAFNSTRTGALIGAGEILLWLSPSRRRRTSGASSARTSCPCWRSTRSRATAACSFARVPWSPIRPTCAQAGTARPALAT
jgi:hypothetical protein